MSRQAAACAAVLVWGYLADIHAIAGEADVVAAKAFRENSRSWRFDVTVRHGDTGWDHYADAFEILAEDGTLLATRRLAHPHEDEQPFTRSKSGVLIPQGTKSVRIRAHDSVHKYGGKEVVLTLPQ